MSTVDHAAYHHNDASAVFDFEDELLYEKCNNMRSVTLQYLPKRLFSKLKKNKKPLIHLVKRQLISRELCRAFFLSLLKHSTLYSCALSGFYPSKSLIPLLEYHSCHLNCVRK